MADYKEGIVESIKIGTLEKQIEILEKLGLTKDEILAKMSDENSDILTIILNKIDSLYEQEKQALVEQLARTLLANQSEASVKYVLNHELIGKVLKHILESDNNDFDDKTIDEILQDTTLSKLIIDHETLRNMMFNSPYFSGKVLTYSESYSYLLDSKERVLDLFRKDSPIRDYLYIPKYQEPLKYCLNKHAYSYVTNFGVGQLDIGARENNTWIPIGGGKADRRDEYDGSTFSFAARGTTNNPKGLIFKDTTIYTLSSGKVNRITMFPVYARFPEQPRQQLNTNHVVRAVVEAYGYSYPNTRNYFIAIPTSDSPGNYENIEVVPFKESICANFEFNY